MRFQLIFIVFLSISFVNANIIYEIEGKDVIINDNQVIENYIEKSGNNYYFILTDIETNQEITLILPEGAILTEKKVITPDATSMITDGRKIIINWKNIQSEKIVVLYEFNNSNEVFFYIFAGILAILLSYYIYSKKKTKNNKLTQNLLREEKDIVDYLSKRKNKEAWTKEIVKELSISKVKLSRKIRSLEAKEIIKKIPYGNENKISLN